MVEGSLGELGKASSYINSYTPSLLFPIDRSSSRAKIGIKGSLPFMGADLWSAYELSWLNPRGKPEVAIARFTIPCESTHIIESKSLKLYLNSLNATQFESVEELKSTLIKDLSHSIWAGSSVLTSVKAEILTPSEFSRHSTQELEGLSLDRMDLECDTYRPDPHFLTAAFDEQPVQETLKSDLLKSNCMVTAQPDWASIQIKYYGPQIDQPGLLKYLISYRDHNEFHEPCVERIFMDLWTHCKPTELSVLACYTRRGGIDISPYRTSKPGPLPKHHRTVRQ
jgi:7-cyano-7-deazaguanine reductase